VLARSGGVLCSCVGDGLTYKPAIPEDGRQCVQETRIDLLAQSYAVSKRVWKPTTAPDEIQIVASGSGEVAFSAMYAIAMSRSTGVQMGQNMSRSWSSADESNMTLDGHHLMWSTLPPSNDSLINVDASARRFSVSKRYAFRLELDCHGRTPCVADGETVETVISVLGIGEQRSEVRITTEVMSLLSCEHTQVWIEHDPYVLPPGSILRVHLEAVDMDGMPIRSTRAEVAFRFGGTLLPVVWQPGSNDYVAEVAAALTDAAGMYDLVVTATNAWRASTGNKTSTCELMRRRIEISIDTRQTGLAAGLACMFVLVCGILGYLLYKKREQLKQLALSFLAFEGILVAEISAEIW
jgi:hypothetical protein